MSDQPKVFYGWVVVATAALGLFLGAFPIVAFSFGVFFPSFVREFHASRAEVSLAFTIHNFLSGIFAVVVGRIADRVIELSNGRIVSCRPPEGGPVPVAELRW